jgi:hypothetical protein
MRNSARAPSHRRARVSAAPPPAASSTLVRLGGLLVLLLALGMGMLLLARPGARTNATGAEHSLGSATAPVVVEEWSDFE